MPPNDGRRPNDDDRIAPIEESGEQREADASRVVHASGFDAALEIPRQLSTQNQILSSDRAGRAHEQREQTQQVRDDTDDCSRQLQHALLMPESTRVCSRQAPTCPRRELLRTTITVAIAGTRPMRTNWRIGPHEARLSAGSSDGERCAIWQQQN